MTAAAFTTQPDPPGERAIPPALAQLFAAIEELDLRPMAQDDDVLAEVLLGLQRASALLDAVTVPVASVWDTRGAWGQDGSKSARARLGRETWDDPKRCGGVLRRARALRSMPLVAQAFRAGRIGTDRVDVLVRANASHRAAQFTEGEAHLVSVAETVADFDDFSRTVRYWIDSADGDATKGDPEERAKRQQESRGIDCPTGLDGVRFLNGRFDAVGGDIFDGEMRRIEQDLFEADWAEARERHGKDARADQLGRTARQRRADALVIMATRSKSLPDGAPLARPLVSVLVDYPTLNGAVRELYNGTVLTAGQVASLLSEADIERIVFAGPSRVLDVGARTRVFRGATRRAIEVRDRRCTFPGCTVSAEWCQVDHIVEWTDGGLTVQENGRLLCPRHNRQRPGRRSPGNEAGTDPPDPPRMRSTDPAGDRRSSPNADQPEDPAHGPGGPEADHVWVGAAADHLDHVDQVERPSRPSADRRSGNDRRSHPPRGRPRRAHPVCPADFVWPVSDTEAWVPIRPASPATWLYRLVERDTGFTRIEVPRVR